MFFNKNLLRVPFQLKKFPFCIKKRLAFCRFGTKNKVQKAKNYNEFLISLLEISEATEISEKSIVIPSSFACKQHTLARKDSLLSLQLNQKINSTKDVDILIREALKTRLLPRFALLADEIQQRHSHEMTDKI